MVEKDVALLEQYQHVLIYGENDGIKEDIKQRIKVIMDNIKLLKSIAKDKDSFYSELNKVIIGQQEIVEHIFIAILCKGHILLEGVPGLGKTLIIIQQ